MKPQKKLIWTLLFSSFAYHSTFAAPITPYHWQGFYIGATAGGVFSSFDTNTTTQEGPLLTAAHANIVNNYGNQTIHTSGFLTGLEAGYNWQFYPFLVGFESDLQALSTNGDTNTPAISYREDRRFVLTSYGNNNWLFTARPRIGWTNRNWLWFVTGGFALADIHSDFLFSNNVGELESRQVNTLRSGYVLGAGFETILSHHFSLKAEYLFTNFGSTSASGMNHNIPAAQTFSNSVSLHNNILRLGINYHFDDQLIGPYYPLLLPELLNPSLWNTEIGTRVFLSTGIDGAPQPLLGYGMPLVSRLTFSNLTAFSGETFARANHVTGIFAKGYLGAGTVTNGQLNDEDFPAGGAYSNTLSNVTGNLSYATLDVGYSFLNLPTGKADGFLGYNYFAQNLNAYSCKQLAGADVCVPSSELNNFLGISEDDDFNSLRLGFSTQMNLTNQLSLTSEAAFIPFVYFSGTDMHNARQLIIPEESGFGDGAMLESVLDYQLNNYWNVGLGGRYWMWNMHNGTVTFNFLGEEDEASVQPGRFNTERYGVFLQFSYHDKKPINTLWTTTHHWKGFYVGGHLGGAWGKGYWTDPFGPTPALDDLTNVPGFGDKIRSFGPLGGANVNFNWQTSQVVYGLAANLDVADIRGENTLFSGLGGVNGETVTNFLATFVGRLGIASNRALFFVNAGPAVLNTTYKINANTVFLNLGSESENLSTWGWTCGAGIEYALTDRWVSTVEYDYIRIPNYTISLPNIAIINSQRIMADQITNVFKVGLNYKFDIFT